MKSPVGRVVEREIYSNLRMWRGLAFSSFGSPILFLLALGKGLGDIVDARNGGIDGLHYLEFIAPGMMISSVAMIAGSEAMWPVMGGFKWMRHYYGIIASPIGPRDVFGGVVLFNCLRAAVMGLGFLIAAALLGALPSWWAVLAVFAAALTAAAMTAPIAAFTVTQDSDLAFPVIFRLGVVPLFLFSGTFFPVRQLPHGVRPFVWLSPVWHGTELARDATTGHFPGGSIAAHIAVLAGVTAVFWLLGARAMTRRLAP